MPLQDRLDLTDSIVPQDALDCMTTSTAPQCVNMKVADIDACRSMRWHMQLAPAAIACPAGVMIWEPNDKNEDDVNEVRRMLKHCCDLNAKRQTSTPVLPCHELPTMSVLSEQLAQRGRRQDITVLGCENTAKLPICRVEWRYATQRLVWAGFSGFVVAALEIRSAQQVNVSRLSTSVLCPSEGGRHKGSASPQCCDSVEQKQHVMPVQDLTSSQHRRAARRISVSMSTKSAIRSMPVRQVV